MLLKRQSKVPCREILVVSVAGDAAAHISDRKKHE
jgi:hypothetical protein